MIATTHIARLYAEAERLAKGLHGLKVEARMDGENGDVLVSRQDILTEIEHTLDRIDNLVGHARRELEDEYLRARDGWPEV